MVVYSLSVMLQRVLDIRYSTIKDGSWIFKVVGNIFILPECDGNVVILGLRYSWYM